MSELLGHLPLDRYSLSRRGFLRCALGATSAVTVGHLATPLPGSVLAANPKPARRCIFLFMGGGASQLETFDCKPGTKIGGEQKTIPSSVPGLEVNEYLPHLAKQMHHLSLIRSMKTGEGNHARAVYYLHNGYRMSGGLKHPALGAIASEQLGPPDFALPHYVTVSQRVKHHLQGPMPSAGYLGSTHEPYLVDDIANPVKNLRPPGELPAGRFDTRSALREALDAEFDLRRGQGRGAENADLYRRAIRMMHSPLSQAFDLEKESPTTRALYGDSPSGQCMLLARRLIESGVTFVEVLLNGWDTHGNHFEGVKQLNGALDQPFAGLLQDLDQRGLLEETLVVWLGEFGRTPGVNKGKGRDHWANGWTVALGGAGLDGGRIVGSTDDGGHVKDRPVSAEDLFATLTHVMGMDGGRTYYTREERPLLAVAPEGKVVTELLS